MSKAALREPIDIDDLAGADDAHEGALSSPGLVPPTGRLRISDRLRVAANQSKPGVEGKNPHAALMIQAAHALDANSDHQLLEFLQEHCSVRITVGSSMIVNPTDLRMAIADARSDYIANFGSRALA